MSCFHGKSGALSLDTQNIAMLTSWTLTESVDTVECTAMGDTTKTFKAGIKGFEGSCEMVWSDDTDAASKVTTGELSVGTQYAAVFYVEDSDLSYSANVILTSLEVSASMDDVVRASASFQGTGAITVDDTDA